MTPTCGLCGGGIGNTLVKHGEICQDDTKAQPMKYEPEIDDLQKMEDEGNETDFDVWLKGQQEKGFYINKGEGNE